MPKHLLRRASTVGALLMAPALLVPTAAAAAPTTVVSRPAVRTVDIAGSATGFTSPPSRSAGITTFRVSTSDPAGIRLGLFRLRAGVPLDRFLTHLRTALTGERAEAAVAGRKVVQEAVLFGGVSAAAGQDATFTQVLRAGRYHLIDYEDIEGGGDRPPTVRPLTVTDRVQHDLPGRPDAMITMIQTPAGPRFQAPRTLAAGGSVLVSNLTGQVDESIFMPVRPGTTSADVQRFFDAMEAGGWPSESPFVGVPRGMPVITPGHAAVIEPALPSGEYALVTWVIDLQTGALRAAQGMHALVTVV